MATTTSYLDAARTAFVRLPRGRQIAGVAALLGLIATFLPWYSASADIGAYTFSASINGWHGWGYLALLGYLVGGVLALLPLTGRSVHALLPSLPPQATEARLVLGAGIGSALATMLFILTEGSTASGPGFREGPSFGAYLGLCCALALAVGGSRLLQGPPTM